MEDKEQQEKVFRGFGTFEGVFTPTILTILGVIMYLRLGWVVGNAGFGGAIVIILLAKLVTITTGLSIASMATNVKVGAGGSYALISRSLGLEVGSSIGIPLFMSQALGGAMYIAGFTEAWLAIFPDHPAKIVGTIVLALLFVVSMISARVAMKVQYVIMAIIAVSLISFFLGKAETTIEIVNWGGFTEGSFWVVFAIFFPAVTGIEAGAAMSGDLKDTKKSLPAGILIAIAVSLVVYIGIAYWMDRLTTPEQLVSNYTIMMDISKWRIPIIAGVFGATLSSALGSIVGGPRTLMALGQDRAVPFSRLMASKGADGEPRFAIVVTTIIIEICIILGDLNTIAPLLTMVFLITYGTINLAVLIEQGTGITSFRPSFRLPLLIPMVGSVWCFIVMVLINPIFAVAAMLVMMAVYAIQIKRGLTSAQGDVRSALFNAIAEWAAKVSASMPKSAKSWKPHLMIPIEDPSQWNYLMGFVKDMTYPGGTLRLFTVKTHEQGVKSTLSRMADYIFKRNKQQEVSQSSEGAESSITQYARELAELENRLEELVGPLKKEGVFIAGTVVEANDFMEGISITSQVMRGMFFPPNIMFLTIGSDRAKDERIEKIIAVARRENMGVIILAHHSKASFGTRSMVNIWFPLGSYDKLDLSILMAMQVSRNWHAELELITVVEKEEGKSIAESVLKKLVDNARFKAGTRVTVLPGDFDEVLSKAPAADLNVFGLPEELTCERMHQIAELAGTSCLFTLDSGEERAWV